jgi:hypothetical protein
VEEVEDLIFREVVVEDLIYQEEEVVEEDLIYQEVVVEVEEDLMYQEEEVAVEAGEVLIQSGVEVEYYLLKLVYC